MAVFTAFLDANVLHSIAVTDILLELSSTGLFRARWSPDVHEEWMRSTRKDKPHLPLDAIERRRARMDEALPGALVTGYEHIIGQLVLPDAGDRHVLAAAIVGRADVIVTFNLRHFPSSRVSGLDLEVQHPDEFLNHQRTLNEALFLSSVKAIRSRLVKPAYTPEAYIDNLRRNQLQVIAAELEKVKGLI